MQNCYIWGLKYVFMKKYLFASIALLAAFSCTREIIDPEGDSPEEGVTVVSVALDDCSKTVLGESQEGVKTRKVYWCNGDCLDINGVGSEPLSGIGDKVSSAQFTFNAVLDRPFNIFYPHALLDGGVFTMPSVQTYAEGSFATGLSPLVGRAESGTTAFTLSNVASVVKLVVKSGEGSAAVSKIWFGSRDGEQVGGPFTVDYSALALVPAGGENASRTIRLDCGNVALTPEGVEFYIVVPAGEYTRGFNVRVIDTDNRYMDATRRTSLVAQDGHIVAMQPLTFVPTGTVTDPDNVVFPETFSGGKGTSSDPYLISTPGDLVALSDVVTTQNADYKLKSYRQTCDIDMSGVANFQPIGTTSTLNFRGTYDGGSFKISNLTATCTITEERATAMFGCCGTGAVIKNVVLENANISSASFYTAAVVGNGYRCTVSNCSFNGSVFGTGKNPSGLSYLGGIMGRCNECVVEDCTVYGSVVSTVHHVGGIVAESTVGSGSVTGATIRRCRLAKGASVNGQYYIAGILGYGNGSNDMIEDCICEGEVTAGNNYAGGICAYFQGGHIKNCVMSSSALVSTKAQFGGGILGRAYATKGASYPILIDKCVAYGKVMASNEAGGIAGDIAPTTANDKVIVTNCAIIGAEIIATSKNSSNYALAGGLAGWATSKGTVNILNCYSKNVRVQGYAQGVGGLSGLVAAMNSTTSSCLVNSYTNATAGDILYMGAPVTSSSPTYHGAILGRGMNANVKLDRCYYDSNYRICTSGGSEVKTNCAGMAATAMTDGTLLSSLNAGRTQVQSFESTAVLSAWVAGSDGYPTLEGLKEDTTPSSASALRVSVIGDSISTFAGWMPDPFTSHYPNSNNCDVTSVDKTWWHRLAYHYLPNARIDMNISFSNTTVVKNSDSSHVGEYWYGYDFSSRYIRCHGMGRPDIILIHGGTNDYAHNYGEELAPGIAMRSATMPPASVMNGLYAAADACTTLSAAEALRNDTFCESYIKLVKMMKLQYPAVKIVCIAGDWLTDGLRYSVLDIAEHYGCKSVDFVELCGGRGHLGEPMTKYSGAHPDANGMDYMARTIYQMHGQWLQN